MFAGIPVSGNFSSERSVPVALVLPTPNCHVPLRFVVGWVESTITSCDVDGVGASVDRRVHGDREAEAGRRQPLPVGGERDPPGRAPGAAQLLRDSAMGKVRHRRIRVHRGLEHDRRRDHHHRTVRLATAVQRDRPVRPLAWRQPPGRQVGKRTTPDPPAPSPAPGPPSPLPHPPDRWHQLPAAGPGTRPCLPWRPASPPWMRPPGSATHRAPHPPRTAPAPSRAPEIRGRQVRRVRQREVPARRDTDGRVDRLPRPAPGRVRRRHRRHLGLHRPVRHPPEARRRRPLGGQLPDTRCAGPPSSQVAASAGPRSRRPDPLPPSAHDAHATCPVGSPGPLPLNGRERRYLHHRRQQRPRHHSRRQPTNRSRPHNPAPFPDYFRTSRQAAGTRPCGMKLKTSRSRDGKRHTARRSVLDARMLDRDGIPHALPALGQPHRQHRHRRAKRAPSAQSVPNWRGYRGIWRRRTPRAATPTRELYTKS